MSKLQGKTAIVTGASKGIGAGIAKELAASGAAVVVNYATDRNGAEAVVTTITTAGGRAVAIPAPIPLDAPVTRAVLSCNFDMDLSSCPSDTAGERL